MKPIALAAVLLSVLTAPGAPGVPLAPSAPLAAEPPESSELVVLYSAGLDALLADARDKGLATALELLDERLAELGRDLDDPAFPADAVRLAHELLAGPVSLRVEGAGASTPGTPPVRVQLTSRASDAPTAARRVEALAALAARSGVPLQRGVGSTPRYVAPTPIGSLVLAAQGDALVVALGEPRLEPFAFDDGLPQGVAPVLHARWSGRAAGELLAPLVEAGGPDAERAWGLLEVLGVAGASAPTRTWSLGYEEERAVVRSIVSGWSAEGDGSNVLPPLDSADFERIPADATFARLLQIRPRLLLALAEGLEPGAGEELGAALRPLLGADLAELCDLFGPTAGAYSSFSTGGGGMASLVGFVEVQDAARVDALLERLAGLVAHASQGPAQGRVAVRTWQHAGARARTLVFPGLPVPLELSLAVHGDALWIAPRPAALLAALEVPASGRSVLAHPRMAPLAAERPADAVAFAFFDAPLWLDRGYGGASALSAALANALRSPYAPSREPGSILPSFAALRRGARPTVSWSRIEGGDLVTTTGLDRSVVANATVALGTPISSLYAGVAGLSIVSSVALPKLMSARIAANESAAIASLRAIASAQALIRERRAIDEDGDGRGEHAFLGELTGTRPLRGSGVRLAPPMLDEALGAVEDGGRGDGVVQRAGYCFQVWLPLRTGSAVAEPASPAAAVPVDADAAERAWCAYAWPVEPGSTGTRVFFVNQEGEVLAFDNANGAFGSLHRLGGRQPGFASALTRADLEAAPARGRRALDGSAWKPLD